jgi:hypothetical protein
VPETAFPVDLARAVAAVGADCGGYLDGTPVSDAGFAVELLHPQRTTKAVPNVDVRPKKTGEAMRPDDVDRGGAAGWRCSCRTDHLQKLTNSAVRSD